MLAMRTLSMITLVAVAAAKPGPVESPPPEFGVAVLAPGLISTSERQTAGLDAPSLRTPSEVVFAQHENGFPVVSEAGFLRVRREGTDFYTAAIFRYDAQGKQTSPFVGPDTGSDDALWGDPEAIAAIDRTVRRVAKRAKAPRLGIGDISARFGGFPDFNDDLVSDHRTHQTGFNVNFLAPTNSKPEVHVHLDRKNDEFFDVAAARWFLECFVAEGAQQITTNVALKLMSDVPGVAPTAGAWKDTGDYGRSGTPTYRYVHEETGCTLYLKTVKGGHSSHLNVLFGEMR